MSVQAQMHNALCSRVMRGPFREILDAGAGPGDVMVLAESIALGALLINAQVFGQTDAGAQIDALAERLKTRFAEQTSAGQA